MLRFVVRRALVQRRMVVAAVVLVAVAATLLGTCALLLGPTQDRAFAEQVQRSEPAEVDVTAYLVDLPGPDLVAAREEAGVVVAGVLATTDPTVTGSATSRMRRLADGDRLGYLVAGDDVEQRAVLTSGRWPVGAGETVLPDVAASRLELRAGDRLRLGGEIGQGGVDGDLALRVVGTFRPLSRAGWETDPLGGAGSEPSFSDGSVTAPAFGPFVVTDDELRASGSTVSGLRVTAHPTLALADDRALRDAVAALDRASALLDSRVGDRARITRVGSDLPRTLDRIHAQQDTTRATVVVVLLLGAALSLAAVLLAGRSVAAVRDEERALLVALGLSRGQQVGAALGEALLLAVAASVPALPAAALAHSRLTHLPSLEAAGLAQSPTVTAGLVVTVLAAALVLTLALVASAVDPSTTTAASRRRAVAGLGVDALLVGAAVVCAWQLRSQPAGAATGGDVTLLLAPVVCLAAATVLVVRLVPLLLALVARAAARSRGLVLPLAAHQAALRARTGTATLLIVAAVAAIPVGLALHSTWSQSQDDQAALRVGTDLALTLAGPPSSADAAAVIAATADQDPVVSAVVDRPVVLGRYVGEAGSPPVLVAVDSRHAGELLRGRHEAGRPWSAVGAELAPGPPVEGVPVPEDGAGLELTGTALDGARVTPTVVLQDASGFRGSVSGVAVPMDGRPHPVEWRGPIGPDQRLVAVRLEVDGAPVDEPTVGTADVEIALGVPGDTAGWQVHALGRDTPVRSAEVVPGLRVTARLDLAYLAYTGADLLVTAFAPPDEVPVAVSQDLADAVGVGVGDDLSAIVGETDLPFRVAAVVPSVPGAPGRTAVLADVDTVSRALVDAGRLEPVVDGWWVADPGPGTTRALEDLDLGEVLTRQELATDLAQGPLRVTVPAALLTLVVAAAVLLLAGVGLVLGADRRRRTAEVPRLRALGLTRRGARRLLLAEHAALVVPLLLAGTLAGAGVVLAIGPDLVRSDLGAAPVPAAVVAWPWTVSALVLGGLLVGVLALTAVVTARQVRRSDLADLRQGDG
ncbi:FtsX-like permease family protein [Nocardioides lianchengensis]|uniref:FtsX-like permease family protein n=1 Tax=Nocardioides lianchengensis TaxID=1045774 RepID=A0A1G6PUN5_9ACTN|nr:FtsX-like permease family protein [Nocardioides lianchengensis]NYG11970.1 hypothetical protein [Nocardioides lianchengensis]SDC83236.1 FtsX-like permease family protein [Nocardioides lianchengensis]